MKLITTFLLIFTIGNGLFAQNQFPTGLIFNQEAYEKVPILPAQTTSPTRGFDKQPSEYSLRAYCPVPGNQGGLGTCVAWASAYGARSISDAVRLKETDKVKITENAFSPSFLFSLIKDKGTNCGGSYYSEAMSIMKTKGVDKLKYFPYTCSVDLPDAQSIARAKAYRIKDFKRFDNNLKGNPLKYTIKNHLNNNKPILIGMHTFESFGLPCIGQNVWSGEQDKAAGGHAMLIIGYDDKIIEGGAFEVMNSWGEKWGDGGFIWIKYADLLQHTKEYYAMDDFAKPLEKIEEPEPKPTHIASAMALITNDLQTMPIALNKKVATRGFDIKPANDNDNHTYRVTKPYSSGTEFRIYLANSSAQYIYVLGFSGAEKKVETIYPFDNFSPYFSVPKMEIALPNDDFYITLDNKIGKDHLCVLFSSEPLNIENIREGFEKNSAPSIAGKVKAVLSDLLIEPQNIKYEENNILFTAETKGKIIVPVVIEIDHVD